MDAIEQAAQDILSELSTTNVVYIHDLDDRHAREALRAELRRLAREWDMRIRTRVYDDRDHAPADEPSVLGVLRVSDAPWDDPHERAVTKRVLGLPET